MTNKKYTYIYNIGLTLTDNIHPELVSYIDDIDTLN